MSYKTCCVPQCKNTTIKTPDKLFISVPKNLKIRREWLQLAKRSLDNTSDKSIIFFCEDHFDMEKDMANYIQYKMGFSKIIKIISGVLPTKFYCQQNDKKRKFTCTTQPEPAKRQQICIMDYNDGNSENISPNANTENINTELSKTCEIKVSTEPFNTDSRSTQYCIQTCDKEASTEPIKTATRTTQSSIQTCDKAIGSEVTKTEKKSTQYAYQKPFRSKALQTKIPTRETGASPMRHSPMTISSHSFEVEQCLNECKPSKSKLSKAEVRQTKIIASLRIHIERVIRRLREFHMLQQHAVINQNFLRIINCVIVIACALINTQDSLIK